MNTQLKNNRFIALFMGAKHRNTALPTIGDRMNYNQLWLPFHGIKEDTEMKYHKSWDWLMPVLIQIRPLICETEFSYRFKEALFSFKIEVVYNAVVEFIKWYNTQNKANTHNQE